MQLSRVEQLREEARKQAVTKIPRTMEIKDKHIYQFASLDEVCVTFGHRIADLGELCDCCRKEYKIKLFDCLLVLQYPNGDSSVNPMAICRECLAEKATKVLETSHDYIKLAHAQFLYIHKVLSNNNK